jgi:hypothetical protein
LLLDARWRTLAVAAGALGGLLVVSMTILGPAWPLGYVRLLMGASGWGQGSIIDTQHMQNWRGFASVLLPPTWSPGGVPVFVGLSLLTFVAFVWVAWHTRGGDRATQDLRWALAALVTPLVSPHTNPHELTLLVLSTWIIVAYAARGLWGERLAYVWYVLLWVGYSLRWWLLAWPSAWVEVVPSVVLMAAAIGIIGWQLYRLQVVESRAAAARVTLHEAAAS